QILLEHRLAVHGRLLLLLLPPTLAAVFLVGIWLLLPQPRPPLQLENAQRVAVPPPRALLVDVEGAVVHPGLHRVRQGDRAYAALVAAGGLAPNADKQRLPDQAKLLKDGDQVRIPALGEKAGGRSLGKRVNLNSATAEELNRVPGFDPQLVGAVLNYRAQYGGFRSLQELITGLGMSRIAYSHARSLLKL
ncbi:MAG: ComEA family DNA-binding protein, partial [Candidatus Dormibacteraceae bacterium]